MPRFLVLSLVLTLALSMGGSACGGPETGPAPDSDDAATGNDDAATGSDVSPPLVIAKELRGWGAELLPQSDRTTLSTV